MAEIGGQAAKVRISSSSASPFTEDTWRMLPREWQEQLIAKQIKFYVIDATQVSQASGMGRRTNTVLQTIVDDDKRGRVMSLYSMAFMGMVPLVRYVITNWEPDGSCALCKAGSRAVKPKGSETEGMIKRSAVL